MQSLYQVKHSSQMSASWRLH